MLLCGAGLTLLTVLLASQGIPGWLIPAGFALVTSAGLFGEFAPAVVQLQLVIGSNFRRAADDVRP